MEQAVLWRKRPKEPCDCREVGQLGLQRPSPPATQPWGLSRLTASGSCSKAGPSCAPKVLVTPTGAQTLTYHSSGSRG